MGTSIYPMQYITIIETLKRLQHDLWLLGLIAVTLMLGGEKFLETMARISIKIPFGGTKNVRINFHLLRLTTESAACCFHAMVGESDKHAFCH
jgi:hypothetical protein